MNYFFKYLILSINFHIIRMKILNSDPYNHEQILNNYIIQILQYVFIILFDF